MPPWQQIKQLCINLLFHICVFFFPTSNSVWFSAVFLRFVWYLEIIPSGSVYPSEAFPAASWLFRLPGDQGWERPEENDSSLLISLSSFSYPIYHCRAQLGLSSKHSFTPLHSISLQCLEGIKENCVAGYRSSRNTYQYSRRSVLRVSSGVFCVECLSVPCAVGKGLP